MVDRFLKAKLTSCQAQLEEVLQAHHASQQEAVELRKQVTRYAIVALAQVFLFLSYLLCLQTVMRCANAFLLHGLEKIALRSTTTFRCLSLPDGSD